MKWHTVSVVAGLLTTLIGPRVDAQHTQIAGVTCASPPPLHCPEANCPRELIAQPGNAILPKSNRAFFLDGYPAAFIRGQMFTGLFQSSMILRLSPDDRARFLEEFGATSFEPMPGRVMREYVVVPDTSSAPRSCWRCG